MSMGYAFPTGKRAAQERETGVGPNPQILPSYQVIPICVINICRIKNYVNSQYQIVPDNLIFFHLFFMVLVTDGGKKETPNLPVLG
jgi:hypothetical protein